MSSPLPPLTSAPRNSSGDGSLAPPPDLTASHVVDTVADSAQSVLRRRFRVLMLVRDAYDRLTEDAPALKAVLDDLTTMLRLLLAWANSTYRRVPWTAMSMIAGAVLYFVMPVDLIPYLLGHLGLMDAAAIIATVVGSVRDELKRFRTWESGRSLPSASRQQGSTLN